MSRVSKDLSAGARLAPGVLCQELGVPSMIFAVPISDAGGAVEIERWNEAWGQLSESNMKSRLEAEGFAVSRYVYPPATFFDNHKHAVDKKDAVLTGRLLIRAVGREFLLGPGDALAVPAGTIHSAEVVGDEPVVSLDAARV